MSNEKSNSICLNWESFKGEIKTTNGYGILMFTDSFEVAKYPFELKIQDKLQNEWDKKLLDIRVFDKEKEYRVFRGDAGSPFVYSFIEDTMTDKVASEKIIDDEQFLDIDNTKIKPDGTVIATGGGKYKLPIEILGDGKKEIKLLIRNYIDYDEKYGQAYIKRWRAVDIKREE